MKKYCLTISDTQFGKSVVSMCCCRHERETSLVRMCSCTWVSCVWNVSCVDKKIFFDFRRISLDENFKTFYFLIFTRKNDFEKFDKSTIERVCRVWKHLNDFVVWIFIFAASFAERSIDLSFFEEYFSRWNILTVCTQIDFDLKRC